MKILFRESASDVSFDTSDIQKQFPALKLVVTRKGEQERFLKELPDADALVSSHLSREELAAAQSLKWMQATLAGVDSLPTAELAARGVQVTTYRGASAPNIGEHVLALMLAFARALPELMRRQAGKVWQASTPRPKLFELAGQRVGILGFGAIGQAIGERCVAMGMKLSVACRTPRELPPMVSVSYTMDQLPAMLAQIDHLVLALPLTPQTRAIIGARELALLPAGAYVYNIGRGDCIDQDALVASLAGGHLGGAGLDVMTPEPLPPESPLWEMPNVIITCHTAGISPRRHPRGMEIIADNIGRFSKGQDLRNLVA